MTTFTYLGKRSDGTEVKETVDVADRYAVYEIARTNGHTVSRIEETKAFSLSRLLNVDKLNVLLSRVKQDELVMLTKNLSSMLNAGLPLSRALSVIERQSKNPKLKETMKSVRESISRGDPLHVALKAFPKVFSRLYVAMVRAGEESGSLAPALETIGHQLERASSLRKKIKGAMIYPLIVISVMTVIGVLMMIFVIPTITSTFVKLEIELPLATRIIIGMSDFFTNHGLLAIAGFVLSIVGIVSFSKTMRGKRIFHYILVRLPVIGELAKQTNSAYTARTLSSLLSSGVDVVGAINITEDVLQNVYYKDILKLAAERVEKGDQLSGVFIENEKLYPILLGEMISVGEETGQISGMLSQVANFYETEVEQKTKDLSTIIEPLLMVFIGGAVGFFALAMIAPIYSISDSIK
jgi:type IV pilus assembly protein PilC